MKKEVVIAGAGLVGSLLSIYMAKRGYKVKLYERRPDMRIAKAEAGRSINLALSDRGLLALEKVGLADEIRKIAIPMHGRSIHTLDRSVAFQPYGKEGQYINAVSRSELNTRLLDFAERCGVKIFFNHKCTAVDWKKNKITFELSGSEIQASGPVTIGFELFFGADGAFSATRLQHQLQHDKFEYHQYYIDCGYKELTVPAGPGNSFLMEKNALHIWPRKDYMLIALPNPDGSFTCTLFVPFEGELSFQKLTTEEEVTVFFEKTFPDILALIPDLTQQFFHNPLSSLVTVKCYPWAREDKFALIGDAAHAIVPFFGQGMNCGFEDCRILGELIGRYDDDWKKILDEYQRSRKPDADAIADLAVNNFTEMRDKTADPQFLLQKKIEARLHEKYPDKWIPAYSQVTFSPQIRYSDALHNAMRQEAIMQEVMKTPGIEQVRDKDEFLQAIVDRLNVKPLTLNP
ncbi:MAG: NAD(P)/FAD-dependent oxidoreductase [Bacteroidota bacterium]|nr:NAD(P)/FAD-dependent oxidoreductase [Bacteroidota bacterium]